MVESTTSTPGDVVVEAEPLEIQEEESGVPASGVEVSNTDSRTEANGGTISPLLVSSDNSPIGADDIPLIHAKLLNNQIIDDMDLHEPIVHAVDIDGEAYPVANAELESIPSMGPNGASSRATSTSEYLDTPNSSQKRLRIMLAISTAIAIGAVALSILLAIQLGDEGNNPSDRSDFLRDDSYCTNEIVEADLSGDNYLNQSEFHQFVTNFLPDACSPFAWKFRGALTFKRILRRCTEFLPNCADDHNCEMPSLIPVVNQQSYNRCVCKHAEDMVGLVRCWDGLDCIELLASSESKQDGSFDLSELQVFTDVAGKALFFAENDCQIRFAEHIKEQILHEHFLNGTSINLTVSGTSFAASVCVMVVRQADEFVC